MLRTVLNLLLRTSMEPVPCLWKRGMSDPYTDWLKATVTLIPYFSFEGRLYIFFPLLSWLCSVKSLSKKHPRGRSASVGYDLLGALIHFAMFKWTPSCPTCHGLCQSSFLSAYTKWQVFKSAVFISKSSLFYMRMLLNRYFLSNDCARIVAHHTWESFCLFPFSV